MTRQGDAIVDTFIRRLEVVHFHGGPQAFRKILEDVQNYLRRSKLPVSRIGELANAIRAEVPGVVPIDDPLVIETLHILDKRLEQKRKKYAHVASVNGHAVPLE